MENRHTIALHTAESAELLKAFLSENGIEAQVERLAPQSDGVILERVLVPEGSMLEAVRLIEGGVFASWREEKLTEKSRGPLVIPVDFSPSASLAVRVGFSLAAKLGLRVVLLHAYSGPVMPVSSLQLGVADPMEEMEEAVDTATIRDIARRKMTRLSDKLKEAMKDSTIPEVKFRTELLPGVPEEVILSYSRATSPVMIVMSTRGVSKKGTDLVGSVAAEVIDSCRVPVLTVPENYEVTADSPARRVIVACSLDNQDVRAVETLFRIFGNRECQIYLVPVSEKPTSETTVKKLNRLRGYLETTYMHAKVESRIFSEEHFREELDAFIHSKKVGLMIVPNKKTNIFRRIFKPSLAHKCLFERDLPLLAIPV